MGINIGGLGSLGDKFNELTGGKVDLKKAGGLLDGITGEGPKTSSFTAEHKSAASNLRSRAGYPGNVRVARMEGQNLVIKWDKTMLDEAKDKVAGMFGGSEDETKKGKEKEKPAPSKPAAPKKTA